MRTGLVVGVLGTTTVAATAALVVVLVTQPFAPEQVTTTAEATTASVTSEPYADERPVTLDVTVGDAVAVELPVGGRVTALPCTAAATIDSGTSPVSIDGVPLLALAMSTPPWRDLAVGDRGADVTSLQAELTRLGHDVSGDGTRLGTATVTALRAVAEANGLSVSRSGPLPMTSVIWLSAPSLTVAACDVAVGATVTPGSALAHSPTPLIAAKVAVMPTQLAQGDRVVTVDGIDLPVDESGAITDPGALTALAAAPSSVAADAARAGGQDAGAITGRLRLAEPVTVAVLPPASIATDDGMTGCVQTPDGTSLPVSIVGSRLGQTYVTFPEAMAPEVVSLDAPGRASCQ